jgi:hypothetical protein
MMKRRTARKMKMVTMKRRCGAMGLKGQLWRT